MSQRNLEKVREIFLSARGLSADQRAAFLKSACGDDAALQSEVEQLLAEDTAETSPFSMPDTAPLRPPSQIGPYTLLGPLGEGGMGVVYKAEQRHPIRRIVALKVIRLGFDSNEVIARFESERQALARMDHPNIARVLDAGTDERGRPYFVMEYVPGTPITKYADENRLTIQQRLELMLQVCDAIGHAHAKAIIHRDIKAGNVLAYTTPDGPRVKVIDFGVAKALTLDRLTDRTFNTAHGQAIGTYESMSPEQADGSPDIDTRTDVYSLGVLLYELLSGSKPFDKSNLAKAADEEIRRIIREDEPPRPSTQLSSMGDNATKIARARRIDVDALTRQLKSELDWIPLMALRKERERRYATPQELAEDIGNYLAGTPLAAAPESRRYRFRKFLLRNRGPVATAAAIVILLLAGTTVSTRWAIRATRAEKNARIAQAQLDRKLSENNLQLEIIKRQRDVQQANTDFAMDLLSQIQPGKKGQNVTVIQAMDIAIDNLDHAHPLLPILVDSEIRDSIGRIFFSAGSFPKAEQVLRKAVELKRGVPVGDDAKLQATLNILALTLIAEDKSYEAESLLREALAIDRNTASTGDLLRDLNSLALFLEDTNRHSDAQPFFQEAMEICRNTAPGQSDCGTELDALGTSLVDQKKLSGAEHVFREALESERRAMPRGSRKIILVEAHLAQELTELGRPSEAEPLWRDVLDIDRNDLRANDPEVLLLEGNLGETLRTEKKFAEAERLFRDALQARREAVANSDLKDKLLDLTSFVWNVGAPRGTETNYRNLVGSLNQLADCLLDENRLTESEKLFRESLTIYQQHLFEPDNDTVVTTNNLAQNLNFQGKPNEAEPLYSKAVELSQRVFPAGDPNIAACMENFANFLATEDKIPEAEQMFQEALAIRKQRPGMQEAAIAQTAQALSDLLAKSNQHSKAARSQVVARTSGATTRK